MRSKILLSCALFCCFTSSTAFGGDVSSFLDNAELKWRQYVERFERRTFIEFTGTQTAEDLGMAEKIHIVLFRDGDRFVWELDQSGREVTKEQAPLYHSKKACGYCGAYGFEIIKYSGADAWLVQGVRDQKSNGAQFPLGIEGGGIYLPGLEVPFTILERSLGFLAEQPRLLKDEGGVVSVSYKLTAKSYEHTLLDELSSRSTELSAALVVVDFDSKTCLPLRAEVSGGGGNRATSDWQYRFEEGVAVAPSASESELVANGQTVVKTATLESLEKTIEESRFRLPHYGLPEFEVSQRSVPVFAVVAGGLGVLMLLYLVFWRRSGENRRGSSPKVN